MVKIVVILIRPVSAEWVDTGTTNYVYVMFRRRLPYILRLRHKFCDFVGKLISSSQTVTETVVSTICDEHVTERTKIMQKMRV